MPGGSNPSLSKGEVYANTLTESDKIPALTVEQLGVSWGLIFLNKTFIKFQKNVKHKKSKGKGFFLKKVKGQGECRHKERKKLWENITSEFLQYR